MRLNDLRSQREGPGWSRPELPLLERAREQELLSRALARLCSGGPSLVTLEGRSGEGHNALLRWAVRRARARGLRVLHARATPAERELRYGAVLQLLTPLSGQLGPALQFMAEARHRGAPPGLTEVLNHAPGTPTLLVIEDVQWLDEASREWLQALVRRLYADVPIALAVSSGLVRCGWNWLTPAAPAAVPVTRLVMRPLGSRSVATAVQRICGRRGDACFNNGVGEATEGNPAVLSEVLWRFHSTGHQPVSARLPELRAINGDIVGERAVRTVDGLPAEARAVTRAVAVCGYVLDFPLLRTLAGPHVLPEPELRAILEATGLIERRDGAVRLRHPSATARVLEEMPPRERAELHSSAAALAHRAAARDEDIAAILFRAPPHGGAWVTETLQRSYAEALARNDLDHATACLSRLLLEPLQPPERARLTLELAGAEIVTAPEAADRRLGNLARNKDCPAEAIPLRAVDAGLARGNEAWAVQAAAEALPGTDGDAHHDLIALYWLSYRDHPQESELMLPVVPALPERPATPAQAGVRAWQLAVRAQDLETTRALARECLDAPADTAPMIMPRLAACKALFVADDSHRAQAGLDVLIAGARRGNARAAAARLLTLRAEINLRGGRLDAAERDIQSAEEALPRGSWHPGAVSNLMAVSIAVALETGRHELAGRLSDEEAPEGASSSVAWCQLLFARAQVACLNGEWMRALHLTEECGKRLLRRGWLNPALLPWRSLAARCLSMLGGHEEAERLALEEDALARRWGTVASVGLAAVTAGPLAEDASPARLREAARILDGAQDRLLHAWSLVQLAQAELKSGNSAAAAARVARLTRFTTTYPSSALAEAVRRLTEELQRPATADPLVLSPASAALTGAERETALLAGRGHGNREIADVLSVSRRTVELRLSSVYKKLHINGRKELRAMMRSREGRPTDAA